jgi:hypothetical protein
MYYVHPSASELFYLHVLLMIVKGARNYVDVRTFNNRIYSTFHEACDARGLLESDNEWNILFDEAIVFASSYQLRELFVIVVLRCLVSNVRALFDKYWLFFTYDIQCSVRNALGNAHYVVPHEQLLSLLIQKLTTIFVNSGGDIDEYDLPRVTPTYTDVVNACCVVSVTIKFRSETCLQNNHFTGWQHLSWTFLCLWPWWHLKNIFVECYHRTSLI